MESSISGTGIIDMSLSVDVKVERNTLQLNSTIQYPDLNSTMSLPELTFTAATLSVITIGTVVGNVLVILSVFTYKPLRIAQNFFLVSLAVADLTVAVLVMPLNIAHVLLGRWIFGLALCEMWLTCDVLCCTASILNLCAIALDRYWAIHDPLTYAAKRTLKRVLAMIFMVWSISGVICLPPLIGWNDWPERFDDNSSCQLTKHPGYVVLSACGSFYIPLVIMTLVYLKIFSATKRRLRERANASAAFVFSSSNNAQTASTTTGVICSVGATVSAGTGSSDSATCPVAAGLPTIKRASLSSREDNHNETSCLNVMLRNGRSRKDSTKSGAAKLANGGNLSVRAATPSGDNGSMCLGHSDDNQTPGLHKVNSGTSEHSPIHQFIEEKQRISLSKERRAARVLGIVMGVFVVCWLPFFLMYIIKPFCHSCGISQRVESFITWLGYINSALNPVIYTVFNIDFRRAIARLLRCPNTS